MYATEQTNAKNVDIWNEAIKVDRSIYEQEYRISQWHQERMGPNWSPTATIGSVFEPWEEQPVRFFMFEIDDIKYCGRKLLSPIVTKHHSPGFFCSLIKVEMLLGKLIRTQISQEGVEVYYQDMSSVERQNMFSRLISDRMIDIYHPFIHLTKEGRQEINTPSEGWFINENRAHLLSIGERHLREVSAKLVYNNRLTNPIVYDPACSTGDFLSQIKQTVPNATVIGQDISEAMCQWAKPKLDQLIHGNSMHPGVNNESCDYLFFRFLNAEVVSTSMAKKLFSRLIRCIKKTGKIILFGHTPVLITVPDMVNKGFKVSQCNEYLSSENAIFQYYVISY